MLAETDARRASSPSTCSRATTRSLLELPQRERRARLEALVEAPVDLTPASRGPRRGPAVAAGRRGRDRQAPGGALPAGRARRHGQDQARAHDRRGRAAAGGRARRRAPSARSSSGSTTPTGDLREVGHTSGFTRQAEARAAGLPRARTRPASASPASRAAGTPRASSSGVVAAARARRRGDLRPHQQRAHPPRREDRALARGQGPARVHDGAARPVIA